MKVANPIRLFAVLLAALGKLAASIGGLLLARSPSNVSRGVIAIVVDALNGVLRRGARAEITYKILEALELVCNLNASPPIAVKVWDGRIRASAFHGSPHIILGRSATIPSLSVAGSVWPFDLQATAASGVPTPKLVDGDRGTASARAFANPLRARSPIGPMKSREAAKCLARKVEPFHPRNIRWCDLPMQAGMAI